MNIERLTYLAEWLEAGAKHATLHFDMTCGIRFTEIKPTAEETMATTWCASRV